MARFAQEPGLKANCSLCLLSGIGGPCGTYCNCTRTEIDNTDRDRHRTNSRNDDDDDDDHDGGGGGGAGSTSSTTTVVVVVVLAAVVVVVVIVITILVRCLLMILNKRGTNKHITFAAQRFRCVPHTCVFMYKHTDKATDGPMENKQHCQQKGHHSCCQVVGNRPQGQGSEWRHSAY
jgi:hypothetical protein